MKILTAPYIFTPLGFKENQAIVFDKKIIEIGTHQTLEKKYPNAIVTTLPKNSVIYPGFINTHVHLEFSSNKTTLNYGAFVPWLESIIANREVLANNSKAMQEGCKEMLHSGITTFGAVSSYGLDLDVCRTSPQRVVFFNECIGSNPEIIEVLLNDFLSRIDACESVKSDMLIPAIAIHSPYALHPNIIKKCIALAKERNYPISAHFLESPAEKEWLTAHSGPFKKFFENFLGVSKPVTTIEQFLSHFKDTPTHFIHACEASYDELLILQEGSHSIGHCPRSNKLLGCKRLEIENIQIPWTLATDGKSSNWSLNIFDELRAALMLHPTDDIKELAYRLMGSITHQAADILGVSCGKIKPDMSADFAIVTLPKAPQNPADIALWTILHTNNATQVYIQGERYV